MVESGAGHSPAESAITNATILGSKSAPTSIGKVDAPYFTGANYSPCAFAFLRPLSDENSLKSCYSYNKRIFHRPLRDR